MVRTLLEVGCLNNAASLHIDRSFGIAHKIGVNKNRIKHAVASKIRRDIKISVLTKALRAVGAEDQICKSDHFFAAYDRDRRISALKRCFKLGARGMGKPVLLLHRRMSLVLQRKYFIYIVCFAKTQICI